MPCVGGPVKEQEQELIIAELTKQRDKATNLLCMACHYLRSEVAHMPALADWWREHQDLDKKRKERERKEADESRRRKAKALRIGIGDLELEVARMRRELDEISSQAE